MTLHRIDCIHTMHLDAFAEYDTYSLYSRTSGRENDEKLLVHHLRAGSIWEGSGEIQ